MKEEWKSIAGYEGLYEVSSLGRVRSLKFGKTKVLKPLDNGCGYLYVNLYKNREVKKFKVHRLVAQTFIPNPLGKPQVNHNNEIKTDNRVENLEWMTAKENNNYGTRNERAGKANSKMQSKPVLQYTKDGKLIAEYPSTIEAERQTRIACSGISRCCRGNRKSAGGSIWKYAQNHN